MPIPTIVIAGLVELAKTSLQAYFQALRLAGKTPEETDVMYQDEKKEFEANAPDTLPDVPPDTEPADAGPET